LRARQSCETVPAFGEQRKCEFWNRSAGRLRVESGRDCTGIHLGLSLYQQYTCAQLAQEAQAVFSASGTLSGFKIRSAQNDGLATAAAVVIFGLTAFFVGGEQTDGGRLAQMKGQMSRSSRLDSKKLASSFKAKPPGRDLMTGCSK